MPKNHFSSLLFIVFIFLPLISFSSNNSNPTLQVVLPKIIIADIPTSIVIPIEGNTADFIEQDSIWLDVNNMQVLAVKGNKQFEFEYIFKTKENVAFKIENRSFSKVINPIPLWLSILPPLIAILMALFFKEVFSALFIGLFSGTLIIFSYQEASIFSAFFKAIFAISDTYILQSLADSGHISIILFSMLIGAMVNLITKNGGMQGVVNKLSKFANSRRSGQFVTWFLGILIFFDDYANTLVVGNTMRPVTDRLKVSREKLAYIVDSTAAPVASIAMITTWIGIELSYIQSATVQINIDESPYSIF